MPPKLKKRAAVRRLDAWEYTPAQIMAFSAKMLGTFDDSDMQTFSTTMLNFVKTFEPGSDSKAQHEKEELKSTFGFCQGAFNRGGQMHAIAMARFYTAAQKAQGWTGVGVRQ